VRFPSKVTPYQDSILAKFPVVLSCLEEQDMKPAEVFRKVKSRVSDIGELLEILDCLYALGKIKLDREGGAIQYVDRNHV